MNEKINLHEDDDGKPLRPGKLWWSVILSICSGIIVYGIWSDRTSSGNTAYEMGKNLPIAAVVAGFLHLCFKSKENLRTSWIGFALIYSSLVVASFSATNRYHEQGKVLAEDLRTTVASIKTSIEKGENLTQIPEFKSRGDSEAARIGLVLRKILQRTVDQRKLYEQEFDTSNWGSILDPDRLSHDRNLAESMHTIHEAKAIITRFQLATDELFASMRSDIETSNLDSDAKRGMLMGFEKSLPQGKANANELWSIEMEIVKTVESIIVELKQNRTAWSVEAKQIVFADQAYADSYNAKLEKITSLASKQDQLRQTLLERSADKINQIK